MNQQLQLASLNLPIGSLDAYIHRVNQIPMLSAEEEYDCAQRFITMATSKAHAVWCLPTSLCGPRCSWLFRLWFTFK